VDAFVQTLALLVQIESGMHMQAAAPVAPAQLCRSPQVIGGPLYVQQLLLVPSPCAQGTTAPLKHSVSPLVQVLVQTVEHPASGAVPEHVSVAVHVAVALMYLHLLASTEHVATTAPSQIVPVSVQIEGIHVHEATPAVVVHDSFVGHAVGLPHCPVAEHVCKSVPEHCVLPCVQATHDPFKHTGVAPTHAKELN
jgi:hypothetical protein